jgi:hypothetical protein
MKKPQKKMMHMGYKVSVKVAVKDHRTGAISESWYEVPIRFHNRLMADEYVKQKHPNSKVHIEGIRLDATPIVFLGRKREEANDSGQK